MIAPLITNNMTQIKSICQKHHVKELYIFGSAARNEMSETSDIDFIIDFSGVGEMEYADNYFAFIESMKKLLGREVDLVTAKYLKNRFFIKELNETKQSLYMA